ncbi:MAG: porin [Burkholderiaceae bacterium]|jgi:predicted porin|nr:porin [Burkholderiaceae bacterium]
MNKKLLVLSLLCATAGLAQAQSAITIYGTLDTGYIKEGGTDVRMGDNATSTLGFKGVEDIGGGNKVTFDLARQFMAHDGSPQDYFADDLIHQRLSGGRGPAEWHAAANVGLKGHWGAVRFGRISDLVTDNYSPFDPFEQGSTATTLSKLSRVRSEQQSNNVRYDSPEWGGLSFNASFTLSADDHSALANTSQIYNHGFAGGVVFDNEALQLTANYSRQADSNDSYIWNVGAAYKFGPVRISAGYQQSRLKNLGALADRATLNDDLMLDAIKQSEWLVGLTWDVGPGVFKLSYNRGKIQGREDVNPGEDANGDANKYAVGYTYNLSKRTAIYSAASYTDSDNKYVGSVYNNNAAEKEKVFGLQLGMTHTF